MMSDAQIARDTGIILLSVTLMNALAPRIKIESAQDLAMNMIGVVQAAKEIMEQENLFQDVS